MTKKVHLLADKEFDVENYTEEQAKKLIDIDIAYISALVKPSVEICKYAIDKKHSAIMYIRDQTDELCKYALDKNVSVLKVISNPSEELVLYAYKADYTVASFIKGITKELCLKMLAIDGHGLQFMDCDDMDLCETAVKTTPNAIRYCNNITGIMAQTAMQGDVCNIIYVVDKLKDEGWIRYLVENYPSCIRHLKSPSLELLDIAFRKDPESVLYHEKQFLLILAKAFYRKD